MEPYIFLLLGFAFVLGSIFGRLSNADLKTSGVRTDGIVFDFNGNPNAFSDSAVTFDDPDRARVRFVTDKQEWITADIENGFGFSISKNYKSGQKLIIYYDPNNPKRFYIESGVSQLTFKLLFAVAGTASIVVGLYKIFTLQ